ncbi:hypothetical protein [Actinoplanes derwentensis]|uniref:Heparinase II/III-like protein n=1 Tax=Actinoplanes derwentensis TaxID=113562 RepID=A0A1H1STL2_9ACTN|nr:hypothetical protein [Actinoplanes derwentensis]GID83213.1 hypothetical protein Ade03nite_21370 [Actinoplanes derwentensis]SDS51261.1 hypothetical protein SAMN04489716_0948 [Actinoplanes derwentensis]
MDYHDLLLRGVHAEAAGLPDVVPWLPHRETMRAVKTLVLASLPSDPWLDHLESLQGPTGLFDGDNLVSPPDSAFTLNDVCLVIEILDNASPVALRLKQIAERSVEAMLTGGVHTPNHRWELASALAGLHHVTGDKRLLDRIDEWLAEGVDIDADGFYSERSAIYASVVTNPSLITLARLLNRPELLDPVRANLRTLTSLVDDDGEVVTVHSRRQDQRETFHVHSYVSQLRRFAVTDNDPEFARLASLGVTGELEYTRHLAEALVDPVLFDPLPVATERAGGRTVWPTVNLVRQHTGTTTTTVFAGSDTRATGRIASGLSNSATVIQVRNRTARLRALRVAPQFFGLGAFRPPSLEVTGDRLVLSEDRVSGYYQPLPQASRRPDGLYPLTDESRFFARMDFPARPFSALTLTTELQVTLLDDGADVELRITGPRTRVAVELVFGDGTLTGVDAHPTIAGTGWLRGETVRLDQDQDRLGVRVTGHDDTLPPSFDDGEAYSYVHGHDTVPGQRVLLGAWSDSTVRLEIRS